MAAGVLLRQKLKCFLLFFAVAEDSLFAEELESSTISVCKQQWSMVEVPCKFEAEFLQMV